MGSEMCIRDRADYYDDNQAEDHVNVRVYSEDDDQITVLVVDVNNNYTQW